MSITEKLFDDVDGVNRVFASDVNIKGKTYVRVFLFSDTLWTMVSAEDYGIINDNVVFDDAPISEQLLVQVATTPEELIDAPTAVTIVSGMYEEILAIKNNKINIDKVAGNESNIDKVADNENNINVTAQDITDINFVADLIRDDKLSYNTQLSKDKLKLKNNEGEEFSLSHNDGDGIINITSKDLSKIQSIDTLDDLRAITNLADTLWVSGYHTKNDGAFGSNKFRLKGIATTETDNGGTTILVTIGLMIYVYELQYTRLEVAFFGADTASDPTISIQNTIDYAEDAGIGAVYFSTITYFTTSPIIVDNQIKLIGTTAKRTAIGCAIDNIGSGDCIIYSNTKAIYDAGISGISLSATTGHALQLKFGAVRCNFESIRLYTRDTTKSCIEGNYTVGTIGIDWIGTYSCTFKYNEYIVDYVTRTASIINLIADNTVINENEFNNIWLSQSKGAYAIRLIARVSGVYLTNNRFRGLTFEKCSGGGIVLQGTSHTSIIGASFWDNPDGYDGHLIAVDPSLEAYANRGLLIENMARIGGVLNGSAVDISLGNSNDTTIINHSPQGSANAIINCNNKRTVIIGDTNATITNGQVTTLIAGGEIKAPSFSTDKGRVIDSGNDIILESVSASAGLKSTVSGNTQEVSINANTFYGGNGTILPSTDGKLNIGHTTNRFKNIYAVNSIINTSDSREKQDIKALDATEKKVALEIKSSIKTFKWNSSVKEKGLDGARIHTGVIAQNIRDIFLNNGLNPSRYGLFTYDEWEEEKDEEGNITLEAGNRYGIRYEELLCFVISAI